MIRPAALTNTHMECRYLKETLPVLTDLLAFEVVEERPGEARLKHPNTDWLLIVHEAGPDAAVKQMHNHYGVRVVSREEVDAAYEYLTARKEKYGLQQIGKPAFSHGSYSLYFLEPGTNGWEVECYEQFLRVEGGAKMFGGVRAPHWETALTPEQFPGRGYVPQGFTHGTLACGNVRISERFYRDVLGLEVHPANPRVVYVKHPRTKCYIVCAQREDWSAYSANFRFTIALEFKDAVAEAHQWLKQSGKELGVSELGELRGDGNQLSFLLSDPDKNWWEITSSH